MKIPQSKETTQNSKLKTQNLGMEDFWSRQTNVQTEMFEFKPFGIPATITANQTEVLAAARLSANRFSRATSTSGQPMRLQLVVRSDSTGPVPVTLPEQLSYAGVGNWITVSAGVWGHGFANLVSREALVFLSPALASETRLVSRYFIDHYLLNFILTDWAMLHASCVLDPDLQRLIVLIGPHNTGKSTTALHLLRAGYHFLADGMALLQPHEDGFIVGGYPIGEVKLRNDVLSLFPEYTGEAVQVREDRKTVVNLRATHPEGLVETLIKPAAIQLCWLERSRAGQTRLNPLSPSELWPLLLANTVYWAEPERVAHNYETLQALLQVSDLHRLELGTEVEGLVVAINER